jgi:hypothetical protein
VLGLVASSVSVVGVSGQWNRIQKSGVRISDCGLRIADLGTPNPEPVAVSVSVVSVSRTEWLVVSGSW